jgi:hypothetical protein
MAPVWAVAVPDRGVVAEGSVGLPWLGRSQWFRYEVRRWEGGRIPDLDHAAENPRPMQTDQEHVQRLLEIVPDFPTETWGLDEFGTGEMWNSNSLTAWPLAETSRRSRTEPGATGPGEHAGRRCEGLWLAPSCC